MYDFISSSSVKWYIFSLLRNPSIYETRYTYKYYCRLVFLLLSQVRRFFAVYRYDKLYRRSFVIYFSHSSSGAIKNQKWTKNWVLGFMTRRLLTFFCIFFKYISTLFYLSETSTYSPPHILWIVTIFSKYQLSLESKSRNSKLIIFLFVFDFSKLCNSKK